MNNIKLAFDQLEAVKRLKVLEEKIDSNKVLNEKLLELKNKQKQMVNAKEFNQWNQYAIYKKEYNSLYEDILEYPFVNEYLDLLNEVNDILANMTYIIEKKINNYLEK